jgi:cell division protein FtsX
VDHREIERLWEYVEDSRDKVNHARERIARLEEIVKGLRWLVYTIFAMLAANLALNLWAVRLLAKAP